MWNVMFFHIPSWRQFHWVDQEPRRVGPHVSDWDVWDVCFGEVLDVSVGTCDLGLRRPKPGYCSDVARVRLHDSGRATKNHRRSLGHCSAKSNVARAGWKAEAPGPAWHIWHIWHYILEMSEYIKICACDLPFVFCHLQYNGLDRKSSLKADKNASSKSQDSETLETLEGITQMTVVHAGEPLKPLPKRFAIRLTSSRERFKTGYSSSFAIEYRIRADVEKGEMVLEPWRKNDHDTLLYNTKQKTLKLQKSHWMAGTQETTQARAVGEWLLPDKSDTQTARLLDCVGVSVLKKGRRVYYWHTLWSPSADFQSIFPIIIYLSSNVGLALGKMLLL